MTWLQTYTGKILTPCDPQPEQICIEDIAHGLALTSRFSGQCRAFYSVAEHSVRVSRFSSGERLWGLLHDAAEAYLTDVPTPVKSLLVNFKRMEIVLMKVICEVYGLPAEMPGCVHYADKVLLATEMRDLMVPVDGYSEPLPEPLPETIHPWPWERAEAEFLKRFRGLTE